MNYFASLKFLCFIALVSYTSAQTYIALQGEGGCQCQGIEEFLAEAEGKRSCVYLDQHGVPTIGIGFNLSRPDAPGLINSLGLNYDQVVAGQQCLSDDQISSLFSHDLGWATQGAKDCVSSFASHNPCVQNVLIDLTYILGKIGFCSRTAFIESLNAKDYASAVNNMVNLIGDRHTRDSNIIRDCR